MKKENVDYRIGEKVLLTIEIEDHGQDFIELDLLENGALLGDSVMFKNGRLSLLGIGTDDGNEYDSFTNIFTDIIKKNIKALKFKGRTIYLKDTGGRDPLPWRAQTLKYPVTKIKKAIKPNRFL